MISTSIARKHIYGYVHIPRQTCENRSKFPVSVQHFPLKKKEAKWVSQICKPKISRVLCFRRTKMCIAGFVWQAHEQYPFILLFNRDEFHKRPTKPISWWEGNEILGGRDGLAGGTWFGCNGEGRVAFLTNVIEPLPYPPAKSRGDLTVRFLESKKSPIEFAQEVTKEVDQYNGFNLILTDLCSKTMVYLSNRPKGEPATIQEVSPGIHVLTNGSLDSPWPKALRLGQNFKELLDKYGEGEVPLNEMVEELMMDTVKADDITLLPHIRPLEWELKASSIFVDFETPSGRYGTRSSAALSVKESGEVKLYEKYLEKERWKEHTVNYQIDKIK